ncbi:hypothetical protein V9K67_18625 [Paraflavisolibacter sp. H34]|uniref:hypothetical protein n=1 Tax=Huijunlia imazamoxiresistens TaxID=3127457 RepID=UPI003017D0F4
MTENKERVSGDGAIVLFLLLANAIILENGMVLHAGWYGLLWLTLPLQVASLVAYLRNVP